MSVLARFLGRGDAAVTVPALDGGLKPNTLLDSLPSAQPAEAPDGIVLWQGAPLWSAGSKLISAAGGVVKDMGAPVTALAATGGAGADERLAVAMDGRLVLLDPDLQDVSPAWNMPFRCITAMAFGGGGPKGAGADEAQALWVCMGSDRLSPQDWRRDLMEKNSGGSVARGVQPGDRVAVVAHNRGTPRATRNRRSTSGVLVVAVVGLGHVAVGLHALVLGDLQVPPSMRRTDGPRGAGW